MSNPIKFNEPINNNEDGFDFKEILDISLRRKLIVAGFSITSFIIGALYAFSLPKLWEGNFQIVLSTKNSSRLGNFANSRLAQLAGISLGGSEGNQLKTEVEILKSPLILLKVFDFVKEIKSKDNVDLDMKFIHWKKALDIELTRDTTVLNITYQDNDREIILPVLNRLSNLYQDYSGKKRGRQLEIASNYLKNEIAKYKKKNIDSLRKEEEFAIANDIGVFSIESTTTSIPEISDSFASNNNLFVQPITTNVEFLRLQSVNKLRNILFRLKRLNEGDITNSEILNSIENMPQLEEYQEQLKKVEAELAKNLAIFRDDDENILLLKNQKRQYEILIKETYQKILESQRSIAEAEIKAAERPEGVIAKYKELYAQSLLDANTLVTLENQFRVVELENAKIEDPWELITQPTILYYPVAPEKKKIAFITTVIGTLLGILTAIFYDRSKNIIYSIKDINSVVKWKILDTLSSKDTNSWVDTLELISYKYQNKSENSLGILFLNDFEKEQKEIINSALSTFLDKKHFVISDKLKDLVYCNNLITIAKFGATNKLHLKKISQNINLQEKNILGLIIVNT